MPVLRNQAEICKTFISQFESGWRLFIFLNTLILFRTNAKQVDGNVPRPFDALRKMVRGPATLRANGFVLSYFTFPLSKVAGFLLWSHWQSGVVIAALF